MWAKGGLDLFIINKSFFLSACALFNPRREAAAKNLKEQIRVLLSIFSTRSSFHSGFRGLEKNINLLTLFQSLSYKKPAGERRRFTILKT